MIILPVPPPPDSILYSGFSCGQSRRLHPHPALRATRSPFCRFATFSPNRGKSVPTGGRLMFQHVFRKQEMRSHQKRTAAPDAVQQSFVSL